MRVGFLVFTLVLPLLADEGLPEGASLAIVVREVRGEADVCFDPRSAWGPAVKGMSVPVGSQFCTGAGASVWLAFGKNSVALVREGSLFRIDAFGMEGDELVARVFIDPGIASVSVVQQQQFLTDFEVSTPRMTASIRGSGETVVANGDEVADRVFVDDHFAEVVYRNGQVLGVREGGATNSNHETPHDLATRENLADVTPEGATPQETANVESLSSTSQGTDIVGSNLTFSPTSNPVDAPDGPAPGPLLAPDLHALAYDPRQAAEEQLHDLGHFILGVGDIETDLSRDREEFGWRWEQTYMNSLSDGQGYQTLATDNLSTSYEQPLPLDVPPEWNAEGDFSEANHALLHDMGTRAFIDDYLLPNIERDFHHDWDRASTEWMDPGEYEARHAEFHRDAYGEGFDRFAEDLRAAADAAALGEMEREMLGRTLVDVAHMTWHMEQRWEREWEGEGSYDEQHATVHEDYVQPLLDKLAQGPYEEFVDAYLGLRHEQWHNETDVPEAPEDGTREAERHDHFHGDLDAMKDLLVQSEGGDIPPPPAEEFPPHVEDAPPQE
ncbi:MAG: hypothetical protein AAB434_07670 [Planctomycetota bacterium]